ncbi:MAG: hypothetical protein ABEH43_09340 [Flavobacteriales bacterium]
MSQQNDHSDSLNISIGDETSSEDSPIRPSNTYIAQQGGFGYGDEKVTAYYSSALVADILDDFWTFDKVLENKNMNWPISQILQRNVSRERIDNISNKFLPSDGIKYFPPIIIAFIPKGNNLNYTQKDVNHHIYKRGKARILNNSPFVNYDNESMRKLQDGENDVTNADGLYVLKPTQFNYYLLGWDKHQIDAVVIDGQHRFEGLKNASQQIDYKEIGSYIQDVIFLEISNLCFKSEDTQLNTSNIYRKIFLDINKPPVQVSLSRQIIMNDNDVAARFVQSLLNDAESGFKHLTTDREISYIQPVLVDWHTDDRKIKFPYLTSVLNLYQFFRDKVFNKSHLGDYEDMSNKNKVRVFVETMNNYFAVDDIITNSEVDNQNKLGTYFKEYKNIIDARGEYELFNFSSLHIDISVEYFKIHFQEPFIKMIKTVFPYKKFLDCLEENYKKEGYFKRSSKYYISFLKPPHNREENKILSNGETINEKALVENVAATLDRELNPFYYILFTTMGQKAIFNFYWDYITQQSEQLIFQEIDEKTDKFVDDFNSVIHRLEENYSYPFSGRVDISGFSQELFPEYSSEYPTLFNFLWEGIIFKGENIQYGDTQVSRLQSILEYLFEVKKSLESDNIEEVDELVFGFQFRQQIQAKMRNDYNLSQNENSELIDDLYQKYREVVHYYFKNQLTKS